MARYYCHARTLITPNVHRRKPVGMLRACFAAAVALSTLLVRDTPALAQANFDRPGGDYASYQLQSGDPADCALLCERDRRCRAWNFRYPGTDDPGTERPAVAICWLK